MSTSVQELRTIVQESLRVQRDSPDPVDYIDAANAISDAIARQNHVIFGRRGCGKTFLMHFSAKKVRADVRVVYINCEDYKQHSFPNVLIEILDQLFQEFERNLTGWFGKKKQSRDLIQNIRGELAKLKQNPDEQKSKIRESVSSEDHAKLAVAAEGIGIGASAQSAQKAAVEKVYEQNDSKIHDLNLLLPRMKERIRQFFSISTDVKGVFLSLDDFYHLPRAIQPFVADYIHRLCKDVPLYFKIATLRHSSALYADRNKQPIGVQEHHDYQPINIDFTLADFKRTSVVVSFRFLVP
jgi:Cdc6-like AAA superfamily ATPase